MTNRSVGTEERKALRKTEELMKISISLFRNQHFKRGLILNSFELDFISD